MTKTDMPPLPEPSEMDGARWGYTADDVRNYGVDAYDAGVAAERERAADIVRNAAAAHGLCCADCVALADLIEGLSVERVALTDMQHRALICDGVVQIGA